MRSTYHTRMYLRNGKFSRNIIDPDEDYEPPPNLHRATRSSRLFDDHMDWSDDSEIDESVGKRVTRSQRRSVAPNKWKEFESELVDQKDVKGAAMEISEDRVEDVKIKQEIIVKDYTRQSRPSMIQMEPPEIEPLFIDLTEKRTYCCHLCGKEFRHWCRLKVHMPSHTQVRNFKCKLCDKAYKSSSSLNVHNRTHFGEEPRKRKRISKKRSKRSIKLSSLKHQIKQPTTVERKPSVNEMVISTDPPVSPISIKMEMDLDNFLEVQHEPDEFDGFGVLSELDPLALDYTPFIWDESESESLVTSTTMDVDQVVKAKTAGMISKVKMPRMAEAGETVRNIEFTEKSRADIKPAIESVNVPEAIPMKFIKSTILKASDKDNRTQPKLKPSKFELWQKESTNPQAFYVDILRKPKPKRSLFPPPTQQLVEPTFKSGIKSIELAIEYRKIGDGNFILKKWAEAAVWYNRSLCHAERKSFHYAIAYAKRAQCFFNMGMYRKASTDLHLAETSGLPKSLESTLKRHKTSCKLMIQLSMEIGAEKPEFEPKLSFEPHQMFPEMANVLQIAGNVQIGRHIIATEAINVGQIVIIERGFVSTTTDHYEKCCICLTSDTNLVPCAKCTKAMLCKRCVDGRFHQIECELQSSLNIHDNPWLPKVIRSFIKAISLFSTVDELVKFVEESVSSAELVVPTKIVDRKLKYRAFLQLLPKPSLKPELIPVINQLQAAILANKIVGRAFVTIKYSRFLSHLLLHHVSVIEKFGTKTCDDGEKGFVETTAPITSYLNHSCSPNAAKFLLGNSVVVVAMRPIERGDQIVVSYCNVLQCYNDRQQILRLKYGIQCDCERCISTFRTPIYDPNLNNPHSHLQPDASEDFVQENFAYLASDDQDKRKQLTEHVVNVLQRFGRMAWNYRISWAYVVYSILLSHRFQKKLMY